MCYFSIVGFETSLLPLLISEDILFTDPMDPFEKESCPSIFAINSPRLIEFQALTILRMSFLTKKDESEFLIL